MKHHRRVFKASDLVLVLRANPDDAAYIVEGATVWLRSGSPPMVVDERSGDVAVTSWKDGGEAQSASFPVACLTPEPSPVKS